MDKAPDKTECAIPELPHLPPADTYDPVVEAYRSGIDTTLLDENLKLSPSERVAKAESFIRSLDAVRGLARKNNPDCPE